MLEKNFEIIKIADIHSEKISLAMRNISNIFPVNSETILGMTDNNMLWIELFVSRFGKLQDLVGSKIFNMFLEKVGENSDQLTMIDKVNKLEKFGIIDDAEVWKKMRFVRNHIAHEYPDNPEITAELLNELWILAQKLQNIFFTLKERI